MRRLEFLKKLSFYSIMAIVPIEFILPHKRINNHNARKISDFYIAGYFFYEGQNIESDLNVNDALELVREPENEYDDHAVAIYHGRNKLGYIPRYCNQIPAEIIDNKIKLYSRINQINAEMPTWERVKVELLL